MKHTLLLAAALCVSWGVSLLATQIQAEQPAQPRKPERDFKPRTVIKKAMPAIVDAPFIAANEVTDEVQPDELVLGVVVGDESRAYPINMLTGPRREIINDRFGGRTIAATW